jgi:hypothetical protein
MWIDEKSRRREKSKKVGMQKRRRCRRMSKFRGTSLPFYTEPHLEGVISETNGTPVYYAGGSP